MACKFDRCSLAPDAQMVHRNYGYAAITAYNVYKNPVFVGYAEQAWWAANTYTLSQKDVDVGIMPVKNFTLKPACQGCKSTP